MFLWEFGGLVPCQEEIASSYWGTQGTDKMGENVHEEIDSSFKYAKKNFKVAANIGNKFGEGINEYSQLWMSFIAGVMTGSMQ